ncbi:MAG: hypothetical protein C0436_02270 [Alphaproteobacteria bacterium]|nr:hypothetical protein [Alphaproteobacteria bacterium]
MQPEPMRETQVAERTSDKVMDASYVKKEEADSASTAIANNHGVVGKELEALRNELSPLKDAAVSLRRNVIDAAPSFVVNHGSNVAAAIHLASEVMMFQASAKEPLVSDKSKLLNYIIQPPKVIFGNFLKGSSSNNFKLADVFSPGFIPKAYRHLTNLEEATERDRPFAGANGKLANRWQMRATLVGLCTWTSNLFLPDVKDTPQETEAMTNLAKDHPIKYVALRLKQAVWVPDWMQHKRQMTGLGVMIAGACSTLGAWRNRAEVPGATNLYKYKFNGSYMMTGLISFASSIPMLFGIDNERGYSQSGSIHLLRTLFLPTSIFNKFKNKESGREFYTAGAAGFQVENLTVALLAGAEKDANGNVVDHKAIRDEAKRKYHERKADALEKPEPEQPGTLVSNAEVKPLKDSEKSIAV